MWRCQRRTTRGRPGDTEGGTWWANKVRPLFFFFLLFHWLPATHSHQTHRRHAQCPATDDYASQTRRHDGTQWQRREAGQGVQRYAQNFIFYILLLILGPPTPATHVRRHPSPSKPKKHVQGMCFLGCFLPSYPLSSTLHRTAKARPHGHAFGVWHVPPPFPSPFTTQTRKTRPQGCVLCIWGVPHPSLHPLPLRHKERDPQGRVLLSGVFPHFTPLHL